MSRKTRRMPEWRQAYERKFAGFIRACEAPKRKEADGILIHHPEALGDDYDEICESLDRIAEAYAVLRIVPAAERAKPDLGLGADEAPGPPETGTSR